MAIPIALSSFICWTTRWSSRIHGIVFMPVIAYYLECSICKNRWIFFGCYLGIRLSRHMIHRTHVLWILERTSVFQAFFCLPPVGCGAWNIHVRLAQSTHGIIIISGGPVVTCVRGIVLQILFGQHENRTRIRVTLCFLSSAVSASSFDRKRMAEFKLLGIDLSGRRMV